LKIKIAFLHGIIKNKGHIMNTRKPFVIALLASSLVNAQSAPIAVAKVDQAVSTAKAEINADLQEMREEIVANVRKAADNASTTDVTRSTDVARATNVIRAIDSARPAGFVRTTDVTDTSMIPTTEVITSGQIVVSTATTPVDVTATAAVAQVGQVAQAAAAHVDEKLQKARAIIAAETAHAMEVAEARIYANLDKKAAQAEQAIIHEGMQKARLAEAQVKSAQEVIAQKQALAERKIHAIEAALARATTEQEAEVTKKLNRDITTLHSNLNKEVAATH